MLKNALTAREAKGNATSREILSLRREYNASAVALLAMPKDVTRSIFSFACLRKKYGDSAPGDEAQEIISHVCQSWRSEALAYPELWTLFSHCPKYTEVHLTDRLTTYLERAQSKILNIWVHHSTDSDTLDSLLAQLKKHSSRWQGISLTSEESTRDSLLTPADPTLQSTGSDQMICFDNLETLDIDDLMSTTLLNRILAPKLARLRVNVSSLLTYHALGTYQDRLSVLHLSTTQYKKPALS